MSKETYLEKAISWVSKKTKLPIKSRFEINDLESPQIFKSKNSEKEIQPDISFETHGGATSYTEIALKSDDPSNLVTRWKLLSIMASMKNGKLILLTPKGHKIFTQKLIEAHKIQASIYSI